MIKEVKRYIERNPYHAGLIAYNLGVFAWLQTNAIALMGQYNVTVPPVLQQYSGEVVRFISNYTPLAWLIGSMILAWAFKVVGSIARLVIFLGLLIVAVYLIHNYAVAIW